MKNDEDAKFVNTLYGQENATINQKALILFILIALFFLIALIWAALSPIDELARGEGKVIPSEKIKTVQSLDGGVISDILVKEGQLVKKDQPLMKIDTTRFQASLQENKKTYLHLLITKTRLEAETNINLDLPLPKLEFPKKVLVAAEFFAREDENLFRKRIEELKSSVAILDVQYKQKKQELVEAESKVNQLRKSLGILEQEKDTIARLVAKGARPNVDLLKLEKEYSQLEGDLKSTKLSIPRLMLAIKEAENRKIEKEKIFKSEVLNELQKVNTEIKKYESKLISEEDKLSKTVLHSPVNGIIKQINMNTIGGVIKSGMDLIEIVPDSEILLVEAKIDPKDIAFINPKQQAIVKITAYDFSIYGGLEGKIVEISADSIKDKESKDDKSYYKVVVRTEKNYLEKNGEKLPIIPGMIASVDIKTGKKTILDFIMKPILKTKQNSLHER
ncbi:secretion protein HylD [Halarcobacter ebronensis]|uniref:Secretion protein HylD n=1 Tax=Halarcobacter ebronensis TaxID=1462615 RepID=A0A4Q0YKN5_9BACT|nr:HlyD family type I secretion periplasmic adaptor subunit [Halarcobacter ebronensis]RXJ69799.1 secretion protein HylD [Halarcobacter ebronensis]